MSAALLRSLRLCSIAAACLVASSAFAVDASTQPLLGEGSRAITGADLVTETSTLDEAARQRLLSSPETVQRLATEMYIRRELAAKAQEQKLDEDPEVKRLLHIVRERVLADALVKRREAQARPTEPVLENLARQNYQANQARFRQPERVHARHILLPLDAPNAREQAEDLRRQVLAGASFADLAKQYSKDPGSAAKGGDLGFFSRDKMVKPFEDAAFALGKPGDVSEVVESKFGYHVIQLVEKRGAGIQPFDEVKKELMQEAAGGLASGARQTLVNPILEKAQSHPEAIEAFSTSYRK